METRKTKKEIVRVLLNQELETNDEDELIDILLNDPIAVDIDKKARESETVGDKVADKLTEKAGSWTFIITFIIFLAGWIILNLFFVDDLDPYPFILLNLLLSCLAALQAPIIMMSQNRSSKKDSLRNHNDYKTDLKSELILEELHHQMKEIITNQRKIVKMLENDDDGDQYIVKNIEKVEIEKVQKK